MLEVRKGNSFFLGDLNDAPTSSEEGRCYHLYKQFRKHTVHKAFDRTKPSWFILVMLGLKMKFDLHIGCNALRSPQTSTSERQGKYESMIRLKLHDQEIKANIAWNA